MLFVRNMTPLQQCEVETAYLFNVCAPNLRGKRTPQGPTLMFRKSFWCKEKVAGSMLQQWCMTMGMAR